MDLPFDKTTWEKVVQELGLCPQQEKLVEGLMQGMSDRQLARSLDVAQCTVRTYMGRLFLRLDVHSRTEVLTRVFAVAWRHRSR